MGANQQASGAFNEHTSLALVNHQLNTMRTDMRDMKEAVQTMAEGITKMGLIERDLHHFAAGQERAFTEIAKMQGRQEGAETRLGMLEQQLPVIHAVPTLTERVQGLELGAVNSKRTTGWVDKAVWIAAGTGLSGTVIGSVVLAVLKVGGIK